METSVHLHFSFAEFLEMRLKSVTYLDVNMANDRTRKSEAERFGWDEKQTPFLISQIDR